MFHDLREWCPWVGSMIASLVCILAQESPSYGQAVDRVYVIRRSLGGGDTLPINRNVAAHSGLLLHTTDGKYFVLEFMEDSRVHLTSTVPEVVRENKSERWVHIRALGRTDKSVAELNWTRQLQGAVPPAKLLPGEMKSMMESLTGEYSVWRREYCHSAQERLRKAIGLKVD